MKLIIEKTECKFEIQLKEKTIYHFTIVFVFELIELLGKKIFILDKSLGFAFYITEFVLNDEYLCRTKRM